MLKLLYLFVSFYGFCIAEKIICDHPVVKELNKNDLLFFESPNFPAAMTEDEKGNCSIKITGNSKKANMYLVLVITNGYTSYGKVTYDENGISREPSYVSKKNLYFYTNETSLKFFFSQFNMKGEEAFQGFITYEQQTWDNCLLAQKEIPFEFLDKTEIYYLRSSYKAFSQTSFYNKRRCLWRFASPEGFGIKLEVLDINTMNTTLHAVSPKSRDFITGPKTIYYPENELAISFDDNHGVFEAKVGIFKLPQMPPQNCTFNATTLIWESNPINTYGNSFSCWRSIEIPPNHELHVTLSDYIFNETGNSLIFFSDDETFFPAKLTDNQIYVFLSHDNDTVRNLTFKFESDQKVINQKFRMKFEIIECHCMPYRVKIPCSDKKSHNFSIMGRPDNFYCAKLDCEFEIVTEESCPANHILLEAEFQDNLYRADNLTVITKMDDVLMSVTSAYAKVESDKRHIAVLIPEQKTKVYFTPFFNSSRDWLDVAKLSLTITPSKKPDPLKDIILSEENPMFHNFQIQPHAINTIKLSEDLIDNSYLELNYDTEKRVKCILLYKYENLTSIIKVVGSPMNLGSSVTIYKHKNCDENKVLFLIKVQKKNVNYCVFEKSVVPHKGKAASAMIAGPHQPCEWTIINSATGNFITKIWTNSKVENAIMYTFGDKKREMIQFNQTSSKMYKQMTFKSGIYIFQIPANQSAFFVTRDSKTISLKEPMLSYFETKQYGFLYAIKKYDRPDKQVYEIANNHEAKITVVDLGLSDNGYLQIEHGDRKQNLTAEGDTFIANSKDGKKIVIFFIEPEIGYRGALLQIDVYRTENGTNMIGFMDS